MTLRAKYESTYQQHKNNEIIHLAFGKGDSFSIWLFLVWVFMLNLWCVPFFICIHNSPFLPAQGIKDHFLWIQSPRPAGQIFSQKKLAQKWWNVGSSLALELRDFFEAWFRLPEIYIFAPENLEDVISSLGFGLFWSAMKISGRVLIPPKLNI